jgi:methionine sulfoxide reductase heme-binding subunit
MSLPLKKNVRFYVLLFSIALAAVVFFRTWYSTDEVTLRLIRLTQYYALLALTYLYLALLIGPAVYVFKWLPARGHIYRARRAAGFSAWIFAMLHADFAFWGLLGGIKGIPYLPTNYLIAITFSSIALGILTLMAVTSFDKMVQRLSMKRWKLLHRFIYLAGVLVIIHAFMLGTHFAGLNAAIPQTFIVALVFLLILQANRFDAYLMKRFVWQKKIPITLTILLIIVVVYYSLKIGI